MAPRRRSIDELIVAGIAAGRTWDEVAVGAGCSRRHVARRAGDPDLRRKVAEARAAILEKAVGKSADLLSGAVGTLAAVMADTEAPPAARVRAVAKLIDAALRLRGELDVELRLARLEELAAAQEGRP